MAGERPGFGYSKPLSDDAYSVAPTPAEVIIDTNSALDILAHTSASSHSLDVRCLSTVVLQCCSTPFSLDGACS